MTDHAPASTTGDKRAQPSADGHSDAHLARRAAEGDRDAAGRLVERHQAMVRHFLRRLSGCSETADDLAQETFLRMLRYAANYDPQYPMRTWLLTIARRLFMNNGRSAARRARLNVGLASEGPGEPAPTPAERVADAERQLRQRDRIQQAIERLSPPQREAVLLFHQQELSVADVAAVMGMPANTVKSHLHRARAVLRQRLSDLAENDL